MSISISTTVFAPTVRTVQPAFIYSEGEGKVNIYFSLSSYNNLDQILQLRYSLVDPNKKSTYENNSMFLTERYKTVSKDSESLKLAGSEYYFTIEFDDTFKQLNLNQYYQIQIELQDTEEKWSAASQPTLIRPIEAGEFIFELNTSSPIDAMNLKTIKGYYTGSAQEYITDYNLKIFKESNDNADYETGWIHNVNGLNLTIQHNYIFEEGKHYILELKCQTVNGYIFDSVCSFTVKDYKTLPLWESFVFIQQEEGVQKFKNDIDKSAIQMKVSFSNKFNGALVVQRTDENSNFELWESVLEIQIAVEDAAITENGIYIYDYLVNGSGCYYRYRFLQVDEEGNAQYISTGGDSPYQIECIYDDIFLSDTTKQFGVKYNPNVSGFKWVVQESITNTLGGKYPLIKRNGDTYYRQFNLSGTIYFDPLLLSSDAKDSRGESMNNWLINDNTSLFISIQEAMGNAWNLTAWNERSYESKKLAYEQRFKDSVMNFLTDGKPKLFKSPTEGMMIVVLTNVSFTPNKQLSRRVVDFSATVTEFAEATFENLIRYSLAFDVESVYYVLSAKESKESANSPRYLDMYITDNQLISGNNDLTYYLRLEERRTKL